MLGTGLVLIASMSLTVLPTPQQMVIPQQLLQYDDWLPVMVVVHDDNMSYPVQISIGTNPDNPVQYFSDMQFPQNCTPPHCQTKLETDWIQNPNGTMPYWPNTGPEYINYVGVKGDSGLITLDFFGYDFEPPNAQTHRNLP